MQGDQPIQVLLVEDDANAAKLFERWLNHSSSAAFVVTRTATLQSAIETGSSQAFDIVVADLGLPDSNGIHTVDALHAEFPQLPLLVLSGLDDAETIVGSIEKGAVDYLIKSPEMFRVLPVALRCALGRHRAEEAFRVSEQRFRSLVESSADHIFMLDRSGTFLFSNEQVEQVGLADAQSLVGRHIRSVYPPGVSELYERKLAEVFETGRSVTFRHDMPLTNGVHYHVDTVYPIFRDGAVHAVGGICRDITPEARANAALRESEARFHLMFRTAHDLLAITDEGGKVIWSNPAWIDVVGYAPRSFAPPFDGVHPDDRIHMERLWTTCRRDQSGDRIEQFDIRFERKDGSHAVLDFTVRPAVVETKALLFIAAHDVSARLHSESQLRALANRLLCVREEERARIAREIHDELGHNLTGLKLDLTWVGRQIDHVNDTVRGELDAKLNDMRRLLDDTVGQVRRLASELRPGILDHLGVEAALEWESGEFEKRTGVACLFRQEGDELAVPEPMAIAIYRVFQELLTNVARHSGADSVTVTLANRRQEIILDVCDDGRGITVEQIQSQRSLGLLGIRERVRALGGSVEIDSDSGAGTRVIVRIPKAPESGGTDHEPVSAR